MPAPTPLDLTLAPPELAALVCCDLGAIVRGRSVLAAELGAHLDAGVSWVPANQSLTPFGPLADSTPFGSTGDLRLLPDPDTHVRVEADAPSSALELVLCDIVETDGRPWECCPRRFLRDALEELERELGARAVTSFEHEFQLLADPRCPSADPSPGESQSLDLPPVPPFSLEAQRRAEPFAAAVMGALLEAGAAPERFFSEFASHQFEIPVQAAEGLAGADRAVLFREVVREVARRHSQRATFAPLLDPAGPGNGVHIHLNLLDAAGDSLLYDPARPACLSELGGRFAAGILRHAGALSALSAPSPVSAVRLTPHRWGAGAVCVGLRNREALLRIPPLVTLGGGEPARQLRLEYRGADGAANPYLALGAIVRAGLDGVRAGFQAPPILDRDPAQLDPAEARRYGVGALPASLEDSLQALADDGTARGWLGPTLYDAYVGVKRAEIAAAADLDLGEVCRRYAAIY
jgi:glutamine synthetase